MCLIVSLQPLLRVSYISLAFCVSVLFFSLFSFEGVCLRVCVYAFHAASVKHFLLSMRSHRGAHAEQKCVIVHDVARYYAAILCSAHCWHHVCAQKLTIKTARKFVCTESGRTTNDDKRVDVRKAMIRSSLLDVWLALERMGDHQPRATKTRLISNPPHRTPRTYAYTYLITRTNIHIFNSESNTIAPYSQ